MKKIIEIKALESDVFLQRLNQYLDDHKCHVKTIIHDGVYFRAYVAEYQRRTKFREDQI